MTRLIQRQANIVVSIVFLTATLILSEANLVAAGEYTGTLTTVRMLGVGSASPGAMTMTIDTGPNAIGPVDISAQVEKSAVVHECQTYFINPSLAVALAGMASAKPTLTISTIEVGNRHCYSGVTLQ